VQGSDTLEEFVAKINGRQAETETSQTVLEGRPMNATESGDLKFLKQLLVCPLCKGRLEFSP
jgi:hypothetical protein